MLTRIICILAKTNRVAGGLPQPPHHKRVRIGRDKRTIVAPGKQQPAAEARAVVLYPAQDAEKLSMTELGKYLRRDISALSRAAGAGRLRARLSEDQELADKLGRIESEFAGISKCQA